MYDDGDDVTGAESSNFVSLDNAHFINNSGGFGGHSTIFQVSYQVT